MRSIVLEVDSEDEGTRIDKFLTDELEDLSRSYVQKLIKEEQILVNERIVKANYRLNTNDQIHVNIPDPKVLEILPENIPLDIVYEDDDIIIVNKPKGMVVHPAAGHYSGTLVNALLYHCKNHLSGINGIMRPGIVHRIDMDTTGILVACKNDKAHNSLASQLGAHTITRKYEAICHNRFNVESGTIDAPIGRNPSDRKKMAIVPNGRPAVTHYQVLENLQGYAHIECQLETGRTHQIRVHMASIKHPLLGDEVYCNARNTYHLQGQTLHAKVLGFVHPSTRQYVEFSAPLPAYFEDLLKKLK
ncbi:MAG: RluA family pseudouridine synthase [Thermoflexaceae bacterium]|nr:RluA family pseudouridine synthase [Thermoflexaceae bacterium]